MRPEFKANALPVLIGSLPLDDHLSANRLVISVTPGIPLWVQLPGNPNERMIPQFMPGLPGARITAEKQYVDTADPQFDQQMLSFYEEYMAVIGGEKELESTRFVLDQDTAGGFFTLIRALETADDPPEAVKGQVTGPFTFCTGIHDQDGNAVFYNDQLKDAAVKLLALKARWQVKQLKRFNLPTIVFIDEPALAGFGSSEFISISKDAIAAVLNEVIEAIHTEGALAGFGSSEFISISKDAITAVLNEVIEAIHTEGALAGVHVCANTDWSLVLDSPADIVSFDAYTYFDRFILYPELIEQFIRDGKYLAWGIVPTGSIEEIAAETAESLTSRWEKEVLAVEQLGIEQSQILAQSLITPSCGTGSLPLEYAEKVLRLTREVSDRIRAKFGVHP